VFSHVRPEAWLDRPIPERHRLLFYLGHLEAFDWNQIASLSSDPLDRLFAFGIDPPPGELPRDEPCDWPSLDRTREYVRSTRRRLSDLIDRKPAISIDIAVEHRLMHVETLTYLLHAMPYARRVVMPVTAPGARPAPEERRIEIPAGLATLGMTRGSGFGWDNEFEAHTTWVERFTVGRHKVTNGRYLAFVEEGGDPPPFWIRREGGWRWRGFDAEIALPLDHPVYATWEQAAAFARWAGGTLPTEAQFHRYAFGTPEGDERDQPPRQGNFDFAARDALAVNATPLGDSAFGVAQAVGNGWEWTRTPFAPFPGFVPFPSYPGYSAPFFDGEHYVLKGASCVTARPLLRRSFRNWFRPGYRHAYTTFRVVES
jgi:formylglycine-generating enzyme required for sulfatase activity